MAVPRAYEHRMTNSTFGSLMLQGAWRSRSASLIVLCLLVGLTAAAPLMADTANAD